LFHPNYTTDTGMQRRSQRHDRLNSEKTPTNNFFKTENLLATGSDVNKYQWWFYGICEIIA